MNFLSSICSCLLHSGCDSLDHRSARQAIVICLKSINPKFCFTWS